MQQRDRDVLEHMIRYCDRIAGYLNKLENNKSRFMEEQMCQDPLRKLYSRNSPQERLLLKV